MLDISMEIVMILMCVVCGVECVDFWVDYVVCMFVWIECSGKLFEGIDVLLCKCDFGLFCVCDIVVNWYVVVCMLYNIYVDQCDVVFICLMYEGYGYMFQDVDCMQYGFGDFVLYDMLMLYGYGFFVDMVMIVFDVLCDVFEVCVGLWCYCSFVKIDCDDGVVLWVVWQVVVLFVVLQELMFDVCEWCVVVIFEFVQLMLWLCDGDVLLMKLMVYMLLCVKVFIDSYFVDDDFDSWLVSCVINLLLCQFVCVFEIEGMLFMCYIFVWWFECCCVDLCDWLLKYLMVSEIVFCWGFNNSVYFSCSYCVWFGEMLSDMCVLVDMC